MKRYVLTLCLLVALLLIGCAGAGWYDRYGGSYSPYYYGPEPTHHYGYPYYDDFGLYPHSYWYRSHPIVIHPQPVNRTKDGSQFHKRDPRQFQSPVHRFGHKERRNPYRPWQKTPSDGEIHRGEHGSVTENDRNVYRKPQRKLDYPKRPEGVVRQDQSPNIEQQEPGQHRWRKLGEHPDCRPRSC